MDYLKCDHCAHLNVIKTEYQTFCSECKKKMNNNFSNWKALHPEQSFDDFKEKVCISESDLQSIREQNPKPKKKGLKFYLGLIITITVFTIAANLGGETFSKLLPMASYDKVMAKAANELNEVSPMMVDAETRLDNAMVFPNNVFQYNYTLINTFKEAMEIEKFSETMEPRLINMVKTNPDMQMIRDHKTTVNYSYKDKEGVHIITIPIDAKMYLE